MRRSRTVSITNRVDVTPCLSVAASTHNPKGETMAKRIIRLRKGRELWECQADFTLEMFKGWVSTPLNIGTPLSVVIKGLVDLNPEYRVELVKA